MSYLRKLTRAKQNREKAARIFARRAARFQAECGWCGKVIDKDEPVFAVGARVHEGIDLSLVEGNVIELSFSVSNRKVLAAVAAFDSDAKAEGKDVVFMVCSDVCGKQVQAAFADELTHGLRIQ